uniref:Uncharacterized protein n=1 Tax=Anguilla anguilla TaxID=7936 RepID=A0A0E9PSN2_ANGAN
MISKKGKS